jgi:hypothetical protein
MQNVIQDPSTISVDLLEQEARLNEHDSMDSITVPTLDNLATAQKFIDLVHAATLANSGLDEEVLDSLENPICSMQIDTTEKNLRHAIDLFVSATHASEESYEMAHRANQCHHPEDSLPSHHQIKCIVSEITGIHPILHHMCPKSCVAFTGPYSEMETCPKCGEARYKEEARLLDPEHGLQQRQKVRVPRAKYYTMLLGPQLQAQRRSLEGARNM